MVLQAKPRYLMKSLAKGLRALQVIADSQEPVSITDLAGAIGTTKTTATRICYTLEQLQLLKRNRNKRYQLTPNNLRFGYAAICALNGREVARYYLENLCDDVQETVNLCILDGHEVIHVIRIKKRDEPLEVRVGTRLSAHCTAAGKVLMAMGPPEATLPALGSIRFRAITPHTITTRDEYLRELEMVAQRGFGINYDELSIGTCAIAAPVTGRNGYAIASVNIVAPTSQYSRDDLRDVLSFKLITTANQISDAFTRLDSPELKQSFQ
jgi:IclR family pca regulon transcriptional regulator